MRAAYASDPSALRGRRVPEDENYEFRNAFQRDRDRIIHSGAFRRLMHKTQVFVVNEGDSFRTRLTHSIEVAQVARTVAGALGLEQNLSEAVALAHDLGHTPFGHTGEDALAQRMEPYGGFDHNAQAVRIVTRLERHYARFDGLNLVWETLEGIAKHNGPVPEPLPWALQACQDDWDLELETHASGEAQVAAVSDDVAYNNHDLHDGLRAGLFEDEDLRSLPMVDDAYREVDNLYSGLTRDRRRHEALRRVFGRMVDDVISTSRANLDASGAQSVGDIRSLGRPVVGFSESMNGEIAKIRKFLYGRMYREKRIVEIRERMAKAVERLFDHFLASPEDMSEGWRSELRETGRNEVGRARLVSDYVAGMTDRFAIGEHERLFGCEP